MKGPVDWFRFMMDWKPGSGKLWLVWFLPLAVIYQIVFTVYLAQKMNRRAGLIRLLGNIFLLFFFGWLSVNIFLQTAFPDSFFVLLSGFAYKLISLLLFLSFMIMLVIGAANFVDLGNRLSKAYVSRPALIFQYVAAFFGLFYLPFSIWYFQSELSKRIDQRF